MGLSGLEPPTLRLSVVRSSQLSYGPSSSQSPLSSVSGFAENFSRSLAPPLQITNASLVCDLSLDGGTLYSLGGDSRVRTGDLLLARQALSQLSYIPFYLSRRVPSKLNNVTSFQLQLTRNSEQRLRCSGLLRKEVIQPHLPIRLPCYDFTPIIKPIFGGALHCWLDYRLRVFPTLMV